MDQTERREYVRKHRTGVFGYARRSDGPAQSVVYCTAKVETATAQVVELMMRIAGVMAGKPMPETVRPLIEEGARREGRVVLRLTPYSTFHSPPKHVHRESDISEKLLHGLGDALPW